MGWPRKLSKMENGLVTYMCAFTLLMGFKWLGIFFANSRMPKNWLYKPRDDSR